MKSGSYEWHPRFLIECRVHIINIIIITVINYNIKGVHELRVIYRLESNNRIMNNKHTFTNNSQSKEHCFTVNPKINTNLIAFIIPYSDHLWW